MVYFIFTRLLFPLSPKESCFSYNPNYCFLDYLSNFEYCAILSSYGNIKDYDVSESNDNFILIEDIKKADGNIYDYYEDESKSFFKNINFVVDIDDSKFQAIEKPPKVDDDDDEDIETPKKMALFKYFESLDGDIKGDLDIIVKELFNKLKSISILIERNSSNSFFIENEETKSLSNMFQEAFFRFNILICNSFINKYTFYERGGETVVYNDPNENEEEMAQEKDLEKKKKKEDPEKNPKKEELDINKIESYFYFLFNLRCGEILKNLIVKYGEKEPLIDKATKRSFDNLIAIFNEDKDNDFFIKDHYIDLLDCIFNKNNNKDCTVISHLEFYKYYYDYLRHYISRNINDDYMEKRIIKNDKGDTIYYKYNKIILDNQLLLKYTYYMNELPDDIISKLFPLSENLKKSIEKIISIKDYNNAYENFFFSHNIFNLKNIVKFCILNIVVLSTSESKLIHFTEPIYSLLKGMNLGIRKYVELILNVSYRVFVNKEIQKDQVNKYFDIYKIIFEPEESNPKKILPNEEILLVNNAINKYISNLPDSSGNLQPSDIVESVLKEEENNLFILNVEDIDEKAFAKEMADNLIKEGKKETPILLSSDLLGGEEIKSDFIYYPYTLYLKLNEMIEKYYTNVDVKDIDKNEYNKLIANVMFYSRLIKNDLPNNTIKFLFYCLCEDNGE